MRFLLERALMRHDTLVFFCDNENGFFGIPDNAAIAMCKQLSVAEDWCTWASLAALLAMCSKIASYLWLFVCIFLCPKTHDCCSVLCGQCVICHKLEKSWWTTFSADCTNKQISLCVLYLMRSLEGFEREDSTEPIHCKRVIMLYSLWYRTADADNDCASWKCI